MSHDSQAPSPRQAPLQAMQTCGFLTRTEWQLFTLTYGASLAFFLTLFG